MKEVTPNTTYNINNYPQLYVYCVKCDIEFPKDRDSSRNRCPLCFDTTLTKLPAAGWFLGSPLSKV